MEEQECATGTTNATRSTADQLDGAGDWRRNVFAKKNVRVKNGLVEWGGHYSTRSPEVDNYLNYDVRAGDVIVCYQTVGALKSDDKAVIGFCRVALKTGRGYSKVLWLEPLELLRTPFKIHEQKYGTNLEHSAAINGPVMLRELDRAEFETILRMSGGSRAVLVGVPSIGGAKAPTPSPPISGGDSRPGYVGGVVQT